MGRPTPTLPTCLLLLACSLLSACQSAVNRGEEQAINSVQAELRSGFRYDYGRFADAQILAYQLPGFEDLNTRQKTLLYYLYEATYAGRDIKWDQNFKHNLRIRRTLEAIVRHYKGDRSTTDFAHFMTYTRQVWFANGIHHHYSNAKIEPQFSGQAFAHYVRSVAGSHALPLLEQETVDTFLSFMQPVLFDTAIAPKKVATTPGIDKVVNSAVNFYAGVTEREVRDFYAAKSANDGATPVAHGLNSRLTKNADAELIEQTWKIGGMYSSALERVAFWLEKAVAVAENDKQKKALRLLIEYYRTGDLRTFDAYNIAWVEDTDSNIDLINGFIEVYDDPIAYRGSFESVVTYKDRATNERIATISDHAQWFEDNMPILEAHKKKAVQGIQGSAVTVVAETGDASPTTPVGINLPNSDWIRANHGSKSITIANIFSAYYSSPNKLLPEFAWDQSEITRYQQYGKLAQALTIDLHEVIGHASGKLNPGVATPKETLMQYSSTSEEGRADLVALYYIMDEKLVDIGVMPDLDVAKAAYDHYIRSALLTQLHRIAPGDQLEEAHMRNRALVARWALAQGKKNNVIERKTRDSKTFFVINDYTALRALFGQLLRELQRIKSEGDFDAIAHLVETYGTKIDPELHAEVLRRTQPLNIAPYKGFVNPVLTPQYAAGNENETDREIVDVSVSYPRSFDEQMLYYADNYSFLPHVNH